MKADKELEKIEKNDEITIVYYAHSMDDYNTEYESKCIDIIAQEIKCCSIINPNKIKTEPYVKHGIDFIENDLIEYFYPEIDKADILIASKDRETNKFTLGVIFEINYTINKGKNVMIVDQQHVRKINDIEIEEIRNIVNDRKKYMKRLAIRLGEYPKSFVCPECGSDDVFHVDGDWHCETCGMIDSATEFY